MLASFWSKCVEAYRKSNEKNNIANSLLSEGTMPVDLTEEKLVVACLNPGAKSYLDKLSNELSKIAGEVGENKLKIEFKVDPKSVPVKTRKKKQQEEPLFQFQPSRSDILVKCGLNSKYKFENFAVSSTNHIAFAAAQSVAENIGTSYNPLFFHGGVGVGKTHLSQSIGTHVLEKNPDSSVYCSPGDQFTNELIESIQTKATAKFRKKYRHLKLLIIDDIQFIAGKQTIQEEFFHTFNSIVSAGGQIVLNSDRPPHEIKNLEDRLRSRFSGGLIVDVQEPDFELRTAILLIKAQEKNISIDMDSAQMIANYVQDTRQLEGTLLSIYAKIINQGNDVITTGDIKSFFGQEQAKKQKKLTPSDIIKAVSAYYDVKQSQIKGTTRLSNIVIARQVAMYILRIEQKMRLEEIAHILKRKDHTTIIHGVDKISRNIMKDPNFKEDIDRIISNIHSST